MRDKSVLSETYQKNQRQAMEFEEMYKDEAFYTGEAFYESACNMLPADIFDENDSGTWFVPYIVNVALACELFLKSLISDGNTSVWGHKWSDLFSKLSDKQKEKLLNHPYFKGSDSFDASLKEGDCIFEGWRYYFEHQKQLSVDIIFLDHFAEVLHDLAKEELIPQ